MSIKDIKPTQMEIEGGFSYIPKERLREVVAEISLKCEDEWQERILRLLSKEEINDLLKDEEFCEMNELSFARAAKVELYYRVTFARAIEVGTPYCVYHDCKTTDCPDGH